MNSSNVSDRLERTPISACTYAEARGLNEPKNAPIYRHHGPRHQRALKQGESFVMVTHMPHRPPDSPPPPTSEVLVKVPRALVLPRLHERCHGVVTWGASDVFIVGVVALDVADPCAPAQRLKTQGTFSLYMRWACRRMPTANHVGIASFKCATSAGFHKHSPRAHYECNQECKLHRKTR